MLLSWDDKGCQGSYRNQIKEHLCGERYRLSRGLEVSGGGAGVVSHAGLVLLRHLAD
jgi:hypothetical protein